MNQTFSKIWIIAILAILIAGGILAWQYWWLPKGVEKPIVEKPGLNLKTTKLATIPKKYTSIFVAFSSDGKK